jgi:hypothetical protein
VLSRKVRVTSFETELLSLDFLRDLHLPPVSLSGSSNCSSCLTHTVRTSKKGKMADRVKQVALEEADKVKSMTTEAVKSRAYLYPLKARDLVENRSTMV